MKEPEGGDEKMFPPHNAIIDRNEAGEPLGWDVPAEPDYCVECGITFMGSECPGCADAAVGDEEPEPQDEYDPGPAVDDEGGMSEVRGWLPEETG